MDTHKVVDNVVGLEAGSPRASVTDRVKDAMVVNDGNDLYNTPSVKGRVDANRPARAFRLTSSSMRARTRPDPADNRALCNMNSGLNSATTT